MNKHAQIYLTQTCLFFRKSVLPWAFKKCLLTILFLLNGVSGFKNLHDMHLSFLYLPITEYPLQWNNKETATLHVHRIYGTKM